MSGTHTGEACAHHWKIDPAAGASSLGVCLNCGEERNFWNISEADRRESKLPEVRACDQCGQVKTATFKNFSGQGPSRRRLNTTCRECMALGLPTRGPVPPTRREVMA